MTITLKRTLPLFVVLMLLVALDAVAQLVPIDLGTLGGTYSTSNAVTDNGEVFGVSSTPNGDYHEFLWTATDGMVDLGPSGQRCEADVLNESLGFQMVVGTRIIPGVDGGNPTERACIWTPATRMVDLGTLGGTNSRSLASNDRGQVVGLSQTAGDTAWHPFVWTASQGMWDLDPFSVFLDFFSFARMGINNSAQIFGAAETQSLDENGRPIERSFVWTSTSGIVILPTLGGERNGARDMNENGQIVGKAETGEKGDLNARVYHAYLWTPTGGMVDLGTLGGYTSEARAVNDMGIIAGWANTVGSLEWHGTPICSITWEPGGCEQRVVQHAAVWTATDGIIDLGTLGGVRSEAHAINDHGDVVGWSQTGRMNEGEHAFVWAPTDGMVDLVPLPGYVASWATHINNRRQIAGYSRDQAGPAQRFRATLWQLPAADWTFCAPENGVCAFTGTNDVRYGANGAFVYRTLIDGTACTNAVFGDPIYGTAKVCAIRSTPPTTEWTFCAPENGVCSFTGTNEVRYGANGAFVYRALTHGTPCTNDVFGDPIYGTVKQCALRNPPVTEWTFCAPEHGVCAFTGTAEVRYGAYGAYVYRTLIDGTACTNDVFGDPIYGVVKACELRTVPSPPLTFTEYPLKIGSGSDITTGPDGALWFTDGTGAIGRITTSGVVTHFSLPDVDPRQYPGGKFPFSITAGPDGALWFTELYGSKIGRISVTGVIDEFPLPAADRQPVGIATGPDGALWYTESSGRIDRIGRITTEGVVTEYEIPCESWCPSHPRGIVTGPDGALWFTDIGSQRIGRITTDGVVTRSDPFITQPGDITVGPDNALWFTGADGAGPHDQIGRITTTAEMTAFPLPIYWRPGYNGYNNLVPHAITTGPDGALWFTSERVNAIGRITTDGAVSLYRLPGGTIEDEFSVLRGITTGPDGALWITNHSTIVQATPR